MTKIGFSGHWRGIVALPINIVVKLIFRLLTLAALFSGIPAPEKEGAELSGRSGTEGESLQNENSVMEEARTSKDLFAATAKIRATDREGNFIEIIY
ncbi:hypothetical protein FTO70_08685 [Methanosarcina sp. KYL-1]|uniref:tropomyosin n=1 Tax=Methanosarcina sp. KYL-1 TaxID=2602068 RepID=UPI0021019E42|nr:tropomyosin [Methanosarcina sp. KYL-1]MCQ1535752.1 hypothetical protein [Methanosarcina sp. KYL-1]